MTTPAEKTIRAPEDVFAHFGADYDTEKNEAQNNERLSRRMYKDTECGAWAEVVTHTPTRQEWQTWTGRYARIDGVWQLSSISQDGTPAELSVHGGQVREYFWPDAESVAVYLAEKAGGASEYEATEEVLILRPQESVFLFRVGSIVEGIDAEVPAEEVALPCTPADLDRAVARVEDEATFLWNDTHGCDDCGEELSHGYRAINPECTSCGGEGAII